MATVQGDRTGEHAGVNPDAAQAALASAREQLQAGDHDGAAAAIRHIATRADAQPGSLSEAAKIMNDVGVPAEAVSRYLEAARGFLAAGDVARARQELAAAQQIDGKNMEVLFELGRADVAEGKKHDGLDKFVEVLRKSNLKHLPALFEAGCLYEQDGQHNQAILAFKRVVDRDKMHVPAFERLGMLHKVRNQLPEAVSFFTKAAEAAHTQFRHGDAKRLAEAALEIDGANAAARRVLVDADKSLADPLKSGSPPEQLSVAPVTVAAAAKGQHAGAPAIADVTPVHPPSAEPHASATAEASAAAPSDAGVADVADIGMPPDVELLEQQSQAMAQLAALKKDVAQTYKQRLALEEEVRKAQAALSALQRRQQSVEDDLSGKREELEKVVAEREAEEAALAALGDAIANARANLESLSSLPSMIGEVQGTCTAASELAAKANAEINGVLAQAADARAKASSVESSVAELQTALGSAREAAAALESKLTELATSGASAGATADAATSQADGAKSALEALVKTQADVENANRGLAAAAEKVQQKRAEADAAVKRLEALQQQRKTQFEEIVFALPPLGASLSGAPKPAGEHSVKTAVVTAPAPSPRPHDGGSSGADVSALIAGGKFVEAAQRAQTEANAQPHPADYLIDVGNDLRKAGHVEEAAKLYAAARDRDQSNARARYELGAACADLGRFDDALAVLRTVETDPAYAVLGQVAIGRCMRGKGDVDAAEASFSKALEIEGHPDDEYHQALFQLAELHESKGDPESLGLALWSYEEVQTGNPNYADVAQRVAKLKTQLGDAGARSGRNGSAKQ